MSCQRCFSVFSRQSDLQNTTVVDGKPVRDWLDGYSVFPDGVLVNHNRVHPDYLVSDLPRWASMVDPEQCPGMDAVVAHAAQPHVGR